MFASKCICKNMARPRSEDWLALRQVGRYLEEATSVVQQFHLTGDNNSLQGYADSDWAGDRPNMKSTSAGVIMCGHCIKAWPISQSALALSSREAELYTLTKVAVQLSGCNQHGQRLWREFDRSCELRLVQRDRNSSQRWVGRSVPTYQGAVLVDPVEDQRWGYQVSQQVLGTNSVHYATTKAADRWTLDR